MEYATSINVYMLYTNVIRPQKM